jgi:hypothetical protein
VTASNRGTARCFIVVILEAKVLQGFGGEAVKPQRRILVAAADV